ncbi:gp666 [Bacillus phage G]|uniref:Gp666 n=1 Tax=Bacillus phage G TaxID=2884420 RepID=G3MB46_9CAUD|nr:gp666 [Bacillus phage G]AEO93909.1 gp666 [Bacillus phage G]
MRYQSSFLRETGKNTTLVFENEAMEILWKKELVGQISDGYWENTQNSGWQFWCNVNTTVGSENKLIGKIPYDIKRNFGFTRLIPYVGDRMVEVIQGVHPGATEKDVRKYLQLISKTLKGDKRD